MITLRPKLELGLYQGLKLESVLKMGLNVGLELNGAQAGAGVITGADP